MKRLVLPLLFLTILGNLSAWAQEDNTLTYEEAVSIALRENIQIQQQRNLLEVNRAERAQAYAQFAPSIGFEASGTRIYGRQFDNTTGRFTEEINNRLDPGIGASLTLFNGFRNINQLRQSRKSAEAQLNLINQTKQDVTFDVSQQYLQVLLDQELLRIQQANLEQQEELLESTRTFVESGAQFNIADLYNQESEVKRIALLVVEAENALTISKVQLIRLLQIDPLAEWAFAEPDINQWEILSKDINIEEAYNQAIANRNDIKQQENVIQANQYGMKVARSGYIPRLTASYSIGSQYSTLFDSTFTDQIFDINRVSVIRLNLNIPIFSNLDNYVAVQRNKQLMHNAELGLEDLKRNTFELLQTAVADYKAAKQRIIAAEAQVKAAEKALEAERERFRLGVGNVLDLNQVNAAYVEAQATQAQANYQLIFQKTALDYYTGKLQPESITMINE
ncbi:TolC family protein [Tunicatimonas pelagia]|uniref:TolC family protein n=1 Tax=Tunicatimonas pelagia TaxID=931531 RepID=UPI002666C150|nr:TolC family protein [Tunicatimonas pelagia]WKN45680.1 TolC family protein [Tunicatimonas pelagia]